MAAIEQLSICVISLIAHHNSLFYAFVITVDVTDVISQVLEAGHPAISQFKKKKFLYSSFGIRGGV